MEVEEVGVYVEMEMSRLLHSMCYNLCKCHRYLQLRSKGSSADLVKTLFFVKKHST